MPALSFFPAFRRRFYRGKRGKRGNEGGKAGIFCRARESHAVSAQIHFWLNGVDFVREAASAFSAFSAVNQPGFFS
jgi:hypothetical protein